jgi:hypothetical protein
MRIAVSHNLGFALSEPHVHLRFGRFTHVANMCGAQGTHVHMRSDTVMGG